MPFELEPFDTLRELLLAAMGGRFPNANLSQRSDLYKRLSVIALGLTDVNHNLLQIQNDLMPDTAEGDFLSRHGAIYGVSRRGAVGSTGTAALRVFGAAAATVPVSEAMTHVASGLKFETLSGGSIPAAGFLDVNVGATDTGLLTNLEVAEELQFDVTPASLEDNARIVVELKGGLDAELDDSLRTRILNRIAQPAAGGNRNDYEQFLLDAAAYVASGYAYPNRNGIGTVDLAALKAGKGAVRLLDASERSDVFDYVDPLRPISATIRVLEVTTTSQDVEILVIPESASEFRFDWDDTTVPLFSSYAAATREITLTLDRPTDLEVGDRIVFDSTGSEGQQFIVESLDGGDATKFTITEALPFTPSASDPIYAGGPIVGPARAAVLALMNTLGPSNPDATPYGPWEGNLRLSKLFEVVQTTTGVLDSTILTPSSNIQATDPAFPNNDTVDLIIPGKILIRKDNT